MINNIVFQQKQEKERLLSKTYIEREMLKKAGGYLDSDLIKVITGPRRAGKSIFSILLLQDKNFAYLNFDDENLLKVNNYDDLLKSLSEVYPDSRYFLFDEIQNLPNWELFVNRLQRKGYNLTLTGSNSTLLTGELATTLTGRYIPFEILPFSFREYLKAKNIIIEDGQSGLPENTGRIFNQLRNYLLEGGYPEIVVKGIESKGYLDTLFDAILFKDIVKRHNIRFPQQIYDLAIYLTANFSNEFSFNKLKNTLNFHSVATIQNYLRYLNEAYLVFPLNRFSYKIKEQIKTPKKLYLADNGLISAKSFQFSPNTAKLMENLTFSEIMHRGYKTDLEIFYYKTRNGKEVDFVLKKGIKIEKMLQVWHETDDKISEKREMKALIEAGKELSCTDLTIITWDKEGIVKIDDSTINFLPLWMWLVKS